MEDILIKIGSYLFTGAIAIGLWIWKTSGEKAKKEENVYSILEALKMQIQNNKYSIDDRIARLEKDLSEQKQEKKELEDKIYVKIASVEGLVTKSHEHINDIKVMVTKISTIQGMENH